MVSTENLEGLYTRLIIFSLSILIQFFEIESGFTLPSPNQCTTMQCWLLHISEFDSKTYYSQMLVRKILSFRQLGKLIIEWSDSVP